MVILMTINKGGIFEDSGINRIAAYLLNRGIEVSVESFNMEEGIENINIQKFKLYKYIGFSAYDININFINNLSEKIKSTFSEKIIFYGSQYVTLTYESILKHDQNVDFLILGDGEYPLYNYLKLNGKKNQDQLSETYPHIVTHTNRKNKVPCFIDISELPWPIHNLELMKKNLYTSIRTSNGCAGDCGFCGFVRRKWSCRSVINVANEIRNIVKKYNIHSFMIADNSFEDPGQLGKERINHLLDELDKDNQAYSFFANVRAESFKNNIYDINLLKRMRRIGFSQLFIGIESGNERDLKFYNKKATIDENSSVINLFKSLDINPRWGFIMLNPYSTKNTLRQNYNFLIKHKSYTIFHFLSYLMVYKHSIIYSKIKNDRLLNETNLSEVNYNFVNPYSKAIYHFIMNNYESDNFRLIVEKIKNEILLYFHLKALLNIKDDYILTIFNALYILNKDFFSIIYEKFDLTEAENKFHNFKKEVHKIAQRLNNYMLKMLKQYYRIYGF